MKVGVFSCGRKAGSLECRMPTVQRGTGKVDTHTYTHTHAYMYAQYVIHFKQTRGLVDPHEALFAVTEATTCLAHTHTCFEQPRQAGLSESLLCHIHTHTHSCLSRFSRIQLVMHTATQGRPCVRGALTTAAVAARRPLTPDSMGKWTHSDVRTPVGPVNPPPPVMV